MKNILVTGGAGYIGSHAVRMLAKQGYRPVILDNLSNGHREAAQGFPFVSGDFSDKALLQQIFEQYAIEAVMHFAAYIEVGESVRSPEKYYQNNTEKVRNLLEVMVESKVPYFIFSSTAAIFGEPLTPLIAEDHPMQPVNPYGRSKWMTEQLLADFNKKHGIKFIALRYFNAGGADESGEIGEAHSPETHLIPLLLQTALGKRESFQLFGTDYPTPDGTCIRDYIHVNDLARAHILALEKLRRDNTCECFNLGSGNGISVAQMIQQTKQVTGIDFKVEIKNRRPGDPARLAANCTKAKQVLGWTPSYSLEKIIQTAWAWEQHRKY